MNSDIIKYCTVLKLWCMQKCREMYNWHDDKHMYWFKQYLLISQVQSNYKVNNRVLFTGFSCIYHAHILLVERQIGQR